MTGAHHRVRSGRATRQGLARARPLPATAWLLAAALTAAPGLAPAHPRLQTFTLGFWPHAIADHVATGAAFMGIRPLGALILDDGGAPGAPLSGLSGLAWDAPREVLYAVSDRGYLVHLRPQFDDGVLVGARTDGAYRLLDERGRNLRRLAANAEALALEPAPEGGAPRLLVAFEHDHRIAAYTPQGQWLASIPLPPSLADPSAYADPNRGIEGLAVHPKHGLLAGVEGPLRGAAAGEVPIASTDGRVWRHRLGASPNSALVDLAALPDGSVIVLERGHGHLFYYPLTTALWRIATLPTGGGPVHAAPIALLDGARGWHLDNFEGIAAHTNNRFFLVSDDNRHPLQKTLLFYFEILTDPAAYGPAEGPEHEPGQ